MTDLSSLNSEQQQAVTHGNGPLLIIAGAGTGKTTVITQRVKYLIVDKQIPPNEILALTFTEKASREMEERVDVALPYGYTQMWISTFHAFCDRILRDEAIHIGLNPAYKLATESEAILFLRKNLFSLNLDYFRPLGNPYKFLGGLLTHFNRLKDDDITPQDYLAYAEKIPHDPERGEDELRKVNELARAYDIYEKLKAKEGIMDFGDLNANVLKLFRARPSVLKFYQQKFQYILVDEFQDTNFAQNELAILLAGEKQNINVVGDDDQAIYRWRGAALANIIQFREHYPNARIITLTQNYRSTEEILTRSHQMIQHNNPDRLEIKENINKQLISARKTKGEPVEFLFGNRVENEAEHVVEKIIEHVKKKKRQYKDFAILVRANDHAQPFVRALEHTRIPYQFLGPGHLFHQEEIKDLIAYLKVLYNFEDSASLYRVLTMEIFGFSARDIAAMLNYTKRKNLSLFEALESLDETFLSEETKEKTAILLSMIKRHLERVPRESAGQILYYFLEDSGLLKEFINPESKLGEKKAQNIAKFFERLKGYEAGHEDASIFAVVDWIDLAMLLGESPLAADTDWGDNNAVNILTIHSSKGLEFPVVFVTNLVSQRFPSRDRKEQIPLPEDLIKEALPEGDQNLMEERRLFYVAMTRARDQLYLTAANYYGEGKRERKLSPFISEALGEDIVKKVVAKEKAKANVQQLSLLDTLIPPEAETTPLLLEDGQPLSAKHPITYISYSQMQTFDMCPLHYKLKYILKIPPFPVASLSFGSSIHAALNDYYHAICKHEEPEPITDLLARHWINDGYTSKSHEQDSLRQAELVLKNYIAANGHAKPIATEIPFQFYLPNLKVGGRVDRVDKLDDGRIEIIDYKTGVNLPSEKELLTNLQLTMYALAATEVHDDVFNRQPEEIVLSLHYVESNTKLTTVRTKEQLEEAKQLILKKTEEISTSDFICRVSSCSNCEYKMICQTYSG